MTDNLKNSPEKNTTNSSNQKMGLKSALVLSGGGARGAYQVGVLKGLVKIFEKEMPEFLSSEKDPFQILSGVSAGAINAGFIAASPYDFKTTIENLVQLWSTLNVDNVFQFDLFSMNKLSMSGLFDKVIGKSKSSRKFNALLDTSPLKSHIEKHCDFDQIATNIEENKFESVIITANEYTTNSAVSFIQTNKNSDFIKRTWRESRREARESELTVDHILASSAIPMLFPPQIIKENGISAVYGDGCVRNNTPCSPSIRMGAERLFVIGVRPANKELEKSNLDNINTASDEVSIIRILNTLLNAVLLDSVEQDVQRIQRINDLIDLTGVVKNGAVNNSNHNTKESGKKKSASPLKKIPALCISPSESLGEMAREKAHRLHRLLRMTISSFGSLDEASEILSYLMFDSNYCKSLIDLGYKDALSSKNEILTFFKNN